MRSGVTYYTYIIECRDGAYYTGYTNDLDKRVTRHNAGLASKYTRSKLPVKLVWSKACKNQRFAMRTENILKKLKREDKKLIIQGVRLDNVLRKYKNL
ncbi:MAG: GIY-YIG nuclease family protein [Candidatus Omnitrophica bacterium]|nr:GIY-YIG nuclease family protein [Candidatus Omnitrophota bacterium]